MKGTSKNSLKRWLLVMWCLSAIAAWPAMAADDVPPMEAADAGQDASFDVVEYRVEGNSVLPRIKVEEALYRHLGKNKQIADVEQARVELERAYRDAGYPTVLVDIPEQEVASGVVRLRVTEGRIDKVRVTGARYFSQGKLLERFPTLRSGSVLYLPDMQKGLGEANRAADRKVTPILKPGATPGTVGVEFKVEDRLPLHGSFELNDRYSANTSRLRLSGMLRYDNLWQREHSLSVQYLTSPERTSEVSVWSASYLMPVAADSDRLLSFYAVRSRSDVAAVGDVKVLGQGDIYGVRAILPLPPRQDYFHSLVLGVDYKDMKENVVLVGADSIRTPISYAPFSVQYNAIMPGRKGTTQANIGAIFSLRGLVDETIDCFDQQVSEFECKRFGARANFFYVRAGVQRTHKLPGNLSLIGKIDGQLTDQPLISNEQFGGGGLDSVRGYTEFERLGDKALRGSLELRSPPLAKRVSGRLDELYLLGFVDGAKLSLVQPLAGQTSRFDLSSGGAGLVLRGWGGVRASLLAAVPFENGAFTRAGDVRAHFQLAYDF